MNISQARENWLKWFKINLFLIVASTFIFLVVEGSINEIIWPTAFYLLFQYAIYHCAYKKKGIKLLLFAVILRVLGIFLVLACAVYYPNFLMELLSNNVFSVLSYIIMSIFSIFYCYISYELIKFNKTNYPGRYRREIDAIEKHFARYTNADEIGVAHSYLLRENPQLEDVISKCFNRRLRTLGL